VYEPTTPRLIKVKASISTESWIQRVEQARRDEKVLRRIVDEIEAGFSQNEAIAKHVARSRRSWVLRLLPRFRRLGFEGLIDQRTPREPVVSRACRRVVQAAREANPQLTVPETLELLRKEGIPRPSPATIKREFALVEARRREADGQDERLVPTEMMELPFAGGELLAAAEQETGAIEALTEVVMEAQEWAQAASAGKSPAKDTEHRDERGHFTAPYNRARRRKPGEAIASYLRSAAEKAEGRVPSWPRFVHERRETIRPKLAMLTFSWISARSKGWASLRAQDVAGLAPLTGFAYMPSTLAKFVSALAIAGVGELLPETVGRNWHRVATARWDEAGAMAAIYIDNQVKEVWSSLFTLSGKVSHRNRVMPCVTTTYAHTGAGTPLVLGVQSGAAPLAPRLPDLVEDAEALCGDEVERATVIDAEGSTFDILAAFQRRNRVIVTPLRPSRAPELELRYSRGSYYRPYRNGDELRVATCTLTKKTTNQSIELGALLVRRGHRESDTVLLTTGLALGMEGRALADLYYARWPLQENAFKEAGVLGLLEHRGNCGRMVANVAVVTKLEQLEDRINRETATLAKLTAEAAPLVQAANDRAREHCRAQAALSTRRRRLDLLVAAGKTTGKTFVRVAVEHQVALVRAESTARAADAAQAAADKSAERRAALGASLAKTQAERKHLEPRRAIRQLDVAQDQILTATKLTAALLISFAIREYLPSAMTAETFLSRIFSVRGRKEISPTEERVVFYENRRDPEVTEALRHACRRLNERDLKREGRRLCFRIAGPPPASRSG